MAEAICKNCGRGINFILLRDGAGWCHSLGSPSCWGPSGRLETVAEPEAVDRG